MLKNKKNHILVECLVIIGLSSNAFSASTNKQNTPPSFQTIS